MHKNSDISLSFINSIEEPIFIISSDYTILDLNVSAERVFHIKKTSVIGKSFSIFCPYQLSKKQPSFNELVSHVKEKTIVWHSFRSKIGEKDIKHILIGSIKSHKDEVKFIEHILAEIPVSVYWMNTDCVYLGCSNSMAKLLKLESRHDIIGKTYADLYEAKSAAHYDKADRAVMKTGTSISQEEPLYSSDGTKKIYLSNKVPLRDLKGEIIGMLGISVDITDRKKMEEELRVAKESAEAAMHAKTEFMANMSHDIRTPLTGVIGMSETLENTLQNPAEKESARMLHDSGQELLCMLNGILDDIQADNVSEVDINKEAFDLYGCVQDLVKLELPTTKLKGLGLKVSIDKNVPRYIISDRKKIHRILLNLTGNAIKFTKSGKVTIEVKCLDRKNTQVHLEFGVADTGIGIPKDKQDKVFDRFFRVTPSYKGLYTGHGLGLHIAQSYVSLLGGHITLTSEEGVGTTFHFDLQCYIADGKTVKIGAHNMATEATAAPSPNKSPTPYEKLPVSDKLKTEENIPHILLVEDNPIALKVLETIVSSAGYRATPAADGEKALALVKSSEFDIIITDVGLPGISGNELASCIRKWEKEGLRNNIPIIGLTGHARESAIADCLESGMNDVFTKPASLVLINEIVNKFASRHKISHTESIAKTIPVVRGTLGLDLPDTEAALFELGSFPIFDPKYGLQQINDLALLIDIWKAFLSDEMQSDFHLMKLAYAKKDWPEVERLAHKIKGGVCYGTCRIFYACQYLERYYKAGHRTLLGKLYHQVLDVNGETISTLSEWLGKYSNK